MHGERYVHTTYEKQYLQRLEEQFVRFRWEDGESFATFETRFETLVNELELVGSGKRDHVKQSTVMRAIEQSNRKDARYSRGARLLSVTLTRYKRACADSLTHALRKYANFRIVLVTRTNDGSGQFNRPSTGRFASKTLSKIVVGSRSACSPIYS